MPKETTTDSTFTDSDNFEELFEDWTDIKLIHESEKGWCQVYSGKFRGRRVAFKTLKQQYKDSDLHKRLLRKEFEVGSLMMHENIAAVLGMETVPGIGEAILMEFVDGMTLKDFINKNKKFTVSETTRFIEQICSGVSYIHSRQIFHCDLKPSNIMVTRDGSFLKIIDFGMCRGAGFENINIPGGTEGFTAPENLCADSSAAPTVDIYSIGKILKLIDSKARIKRVWRKCSSENPDKRPKSISEVSELIKRYYQHRKWRLNVGTILGILFLIGVIVLIRLTVKSVPEQNITQREDGNKPDSTIENNYIPTNDISETATHSNTGKSATQRPTSIINISEESPVEINRPIDTESSAFKEKLTETFQTIVGCRFKDHLTLIDTMTTQKSCQLQQVGHWRWLAKQDMRKWLENELYPNYPKVEEIMKDVERWVKEYGEFSQRKGIEYSHRINAAKRNPDMSGCTTSYAYYETMDELVVRKMGEDGEWDEKRIRVPINRLDPVETMKIKDEYMKKALAD